jgi:hypothetical protein
MKRALSILLALSLASALLLPGCASTESALSQNRRTAYGAVAGAAGGAAVGALAGGKKGVLVGGLLGAFAGGAIGHYLDSREKGPEEAAREYGYKPSEGNRLVLESVRVNPASAAAGETVNVNLTYAVLLPASGGQLPVKETREISLDGKALAKPVVDVTREGGVWKSTVPVTLPPNAAPGSYRVVATVEAEGSRETRETFFKVAP